MDTFHDWLRIPLLKSSEAGYLIFGREPDGPLVVKILDDLARAELTPGTDTDLAFSKLIDRVTLSGELQATEDSDGNLLVTPRDVFEFAMAQGLKMESSLHATWLEVLNESASADTMPATVPDKQSMHPSGIQITDKEPEKNVRAEWWISTDDGALFFRTFTNEIKDGVAEFKRDTKNREVMVLLCERGNKGLSIAEILKAAYPKDLEKLEEILREAPRESTRDALLDYYKNADVHKILKKAKQICRTVQQKLENKGIPNEVIEILPGLERFIVENPSAPMVFLRVQSLQKKSGNGIRMHPSIVNASGLSEHDTNTNRPHVL